jgi:hypothetical protein
LKQDSRRYYRFAVRIIAHLKKKNAGNTEEFHSLLQSNLNTFWCVLICDRTIRGYRPSKELYY